MRAFCSIFVRCCSCGLFAVDSISGNSQIMTTRRSLIYVLLCIFHNANHQARAAATPRGYQDDIDIPTYDGGNPSVYASSEASILSAVSSSSLILNASSSQSTSVEASSTFASPTSSSSPPVEPQQDGCSYWYEDMPHQGISAFNGDSSYQVFRSVKDFGARGMLDAVSWCCLLIDNILQATE